MIFKWKTLVSLKKKLVPRGIWLQIFISFAVALSNMSDGMTVGWTASKVAEMTHSDTNSTAQMTLAEASLVGTLPTYATLITTPFAIFSSNSIGRKWTILWGSLLTFLSWMFLIFSNHLTIIYISVILRGLGCFVIYTTNQIYIAEIAQTNIRGFLGTFVPVLMNLGTLLSYICIMCISLQDLAICGAVIGGILFPCLLFAPLSPYYLFLKKNPKGARLSLEKLRNYGQIHETIEDIKINDGYTKQVSLKDLITNPLGRQTLLSSSNKIRSIDHLDEDVSSFKSSVQNSYLSLKDLIRHSTDRQILLSLLEELQDTYQINPELQQIAELFHNKLYDGKILASLLKLVENSDQADKELEEINTTLKNVDMSLKGFLTFPLKHEIMPQVEHIFQKSGQLIKESAEIRTILEDLEVSLIGLLTLHTDQTTTLLLLKESNDNQLPNELETVQYVLKNLDSSLKKLLIFLEKIQKVILNKDGEEVITVTENLKFSLNIFIVRLVDQQNLLSLLKNIREEQFTEKDLDEIKTITEILKLPLKKTVPRDQIFHSILLEKRQDIQMDKNVDDIKLIFENLELSLRGLITIADQKIMQLLLKKLQNKSPVNENIDKTKSIVQDLELYVNELAIQTVDETVMLSLLEKLKNSDLLNEDEDLKSFIENLILSLGELTIYPVNRQKLSLLVKKLQKCSADKNLDDICSGIKYLEFFLRKIKTHFLNQKLLVDCLIKLQNGDEIYKVLEEIKSCFENPKFFKHSSPREHRILQSILIPLQIKNLPIKDLSDTKITFKNFKQISLRQLTVNPQSRKMLESFLESLRKYSKIDKELEEIKITVENLEKGSFKELVTDRRNRKIFFIVLMVQVFQQLSGIDAILIFLHVILGESSENGFNKMSSVIFGAGKLISCSLALLLLDKVGRKPLLIISCLISCVALAALGGYFFVKNTIHADVESLSWLPLVILLVYILGYNIGLGTVPFILGSEMFPTKFKAFGVAANEIVYCIAMIATTALVAWLKDSYGFYLAFWFLAVCTFIGFLFCVTYVVETKGKSFKEILINLI